MGVMSIPHKPEPFTHAPNSRLPTNSFSAMYSFGGVGIGKLRPLKKRIDFVSFNPWKLIFFVEEDKYVRSNGSNIELPFIIALECVLFDLKATWLKIPPVCEK